LRMIMAPPSLQMQRLRDQGSHLDWPTRARSVWLEQAPPLDCRP
jgi:hypothetical protein